MPHHRYKRDCQKQMGLQTYSLGQELLKDMPNGLNRLAKMGFTELEIFGYKEDSGKFGDYSRDNTTFIDPKDYKKMVDDAGMKITSSHLTPMLREYTKENISKFEDFWKKRPISTPSWAFLIWYNQACPRSRTRTTLSRSARSSTVPARSPRKLVSNGVITTTATSSSVS